MRTAFVLGLAACSAPMATSDDTPVSPDSYINCQTPDFMFQAPRAIEHYDPDLVIIADMAAFYANGLPGVTCTDDVGTVFLPTAAPTTSDLPTGQVEMRWQMQLEPSHRYEARFQATECDQTVLFFTSAAP